MPQLLQVLHDIGERLDKRVQVDAIYLDFAKAFNRINHKLLLKTSAPQIRHLWYPVVLVRRLLYLTGRVQRVTVLGVNSKFLNLPVLSRVPQGSMLGPLLFLLYMYVNDLPVVATSTSVALFADDTKCYRAINSMEDGVNCLQRDLDNISQWCDFWQMDLNESKCRLLSITRNTSPFHFPYQLSNV